VGKKKKYFRIGTWPHTSVFFSFESVSDKLDDDEDCDLAVVDDVAVEDEAPAGDGNGVIVTVVRANDETQRSRRPRIDCQRKLKSCGMNDVYDNEYTSIIDIYFYESLCTRFR